MLDSILHARDHKINEYVHQGTTSGRDEQTHLANAVISLSRRGAHRAQALPEIYAEILGAAVERVP